jgi:putative ABC transport system permease protein
MRQFFDNVVQDSRYALRSFLKTPGFAALAILTLALGIGANSAIFSVVYGMLLRPLPYRDADRLVLIQRERDVSGAHRPAPLFFSSRTENDEWISQTSALEAIALYAPDVAAISDDNGTELLDAAIVSGTFFSTLGSALKAGRPFGVADDQTPSVVVSDRLARRLFGGTAEAVGQQVTLSSQPFTIIGVAGPEFQFPTPQNDVWMPEGLTRTRNARCCGFRMLGRLKPGETVARASSEADRLAKTVGQIAATSATSSIRANAVSLADDMTKAIRPSLLVLFTATALALAIACANVANLMLSRQATNGREMALRSALGASRARLAAQSLTEAAVIAIAGGVAGVMLAMVIVTVLVPLAPMPSVGAVRVDLPVLLFSVVLAAAVAIGTSILPALQSANASEALKSGAPSVAGALPGRRIRRTLCVAEIAVSLVLLVGASLLGRSLVRLLRTDLGVTTDRVVTATLSIFGARPSDAELSARLGRVVERVHGMPGVDVVGLGTALPPVVSRIRLGLRRPGELVEYSAALVGGTPDYFRALGMRLVAGRWFTEQDDLDHQPVMIMTADTAKRFFGDGDPVGRSTKIPYIRNGQNGQEDVTLVGVVANVKYTGLENQADDVVYRPLLQQMWPPYLVARTNGSTDAVVASLAREIAVVDRGFVVSAVKELDAIVSDQAAQPRFRTVLLGSIAGLALALAAVGLYGVVAYSVSQRTKEIGIRMALGAGGHDVLTMVLREGTLIAVAGIVAGSAIAYAATRILAGLLYGIAPTDLTSFVIAGGGLLIVMLVASYVPARRATKVDPIEALRT